MSDPAYYLTFTHACQTCGETVQVTDGKQEDHPCPEAPALVIEGCNASTPLVARVEQALSDYESLTATPGRGEFCHRHFSWLCQAGQGKCQRGEDQP